MDYLRGARGRVYSYGEWDCGIFVAGAVEAMTGDDPGKAFRGQYKDAKGAAAALKKHGKGTLIKTLDGMFERIPKAQAKRGDIAMVGTAIGVVAGGEALFVGQEGEREGLVSFPRAEWSRAWAVD